MKCRERFNRLMRFEPVDRLPVVEWASWWDKTLTRWWGEGLPKELADPGDIREYFGQDTWRQFGAGPRRASLEGAGSYGEGLVSTLADYERIKPHLFPSPGEVIGRERLQACAARQAAGEMVVWLTLEGFFWFPRTLFAIEKHLCAFYEQPEAMHAMNAGLLDFNLAALDAFCAVCVPDFITFAEDMSYRNGPMISKELFDTFMAPYYRPLVAEIRSRGIQPFVDTDGNIDALVPWFIEVGIDGFLPIERQAGCDPAALRKRHPGIRMIGGFDKTVMSRGEAAMRHEFDRLLPAMRQGGYVASVDHQTPPDVSLDAYRVFLGLLREYAQEAAKTS